MRTQELLTDCLVEGDPATVARRRRSRRISLLLSLLVQIALLGFLLLAPLFAKTERITWQMAVPIPPYKGYRETKQRPTQNPAAANQRPRVPIRPTPGLYQPRYVPREVIEGPVDPPAQMENSSVTSPCPACPRSSGEELIDLFARAGERTTPARPAPPPRQARIVVSQPVQEALLVNRVEPRYPPLAVQMRLEGKVELRAIIGRDGSIHSLEVLSGHPLFLEETKRAILQWRYQPTLLNGEPVEVETRITVVFTLQR
jgi:protein TonB